MIFILSRESDATAMRIIQKIKLQNKDLPVRLIYEEDLLKETDILSINRDDIFVFGVPINKIKSIWVRKWNWSSMMGTFNTSEYQYQMAYELQFVFDAIVNMNNANILGYYNLTMHNKLIQAYYAQIAGLNVPRTQVGYNVPIKRKWLSKPFNRPIYINDRIFNYQTLRISKGITKAEGLAFLQEEIRKKKEVRALIIGKQIFAIETNSNVSVNVDNRYSDVSNYYPHNINDTIKKKLLKITKLLCCNFCVCDLLLDEKDTYFFLEANPFGQFDEIIKFGHYDIDKIIINFLLK